MMFPISRHLSLLFALLIPLCPAQNEAAPSQAASWAPAIMVRDVPYQSVNELRNFYKLDTVARASRKGALAMGNSDISLELGPGPLSMRLGGIPLALAHPLARDTKGNLLLSRSDWVMWLDPILRPTYIQKREVISTVVIDAGHGGRDTGASFDGTSEKQVVLLVAQALKQQLETIGLRVVLTRDSDIFVSDQQRVDTTADMQQAVFLSLHVNSADPSACGPEVYRLAPPRDARHPAPGNGEDARNAALAYAVESALSSVAGRVSAGCCYAHYTLLSSLRIPAVWVELGYATNDREGKLLNSPEYREKLAQAIARGVATFARATNPQTKLTVTQAPKVTKPATPPSTPRNETKGASRASDSNRNNRSRSRRRRRN